MKRIYEPHQHALIKYPDIVVTADPNTVARQTQLALKATITVPAYLARQLDFKHGEVLKIEKDGDSIVIKRLGGDIVDARLGRLNRAYTKRELLSRKERAIKQLRRKLIEFPDDDAALEKLHKRIAEVRQLKEELRTEETK